MADKNALMFATVPLSVRLSVLLPVTVTPPLPVAVILPESTANVTLIELAPASTSARFNPLNVNAVSSFVVQLVGKVLTGASFTALTTIVLLLKVVPTPSLEVIFRVTVPL